MASVRVLFSLGFVPFVLAACGSGSDDSPSAKAASTQDLTDYCAASCAHEAACDSPPPDGAACKSECATKNSAVLPKTRADFLQSTIACIKGLDCSVVPGGRGVSNCNDQEVAKVTPSAAASSFCDALDGAATRCRGTPDRDKCLNAVKIHTDGSLADAQACTSKDCSEIVACVDTALGY